MQDAVRSPRRGERSIPRDRVAHQRADKELRAALERGTPCDRLGRSCASASTSRIARSDERTYRAPGRSSCGLDETGMCYGGRSRAVDRSRVDARGRLPMRAPEWGRIQESPVAGRAGAPVDRSFAARSWPGCAAASSTYRSRREIVLAAGDPEVGEERMTDTEERKGWPVFFKEDQGLFGTLDLVYKRASGWDGLDDPGALRGLYAEFLDEARRCRGPSRARAQSPPAIATLAEKWSDLAEAALPERNRAAPRGGSAARGAASAV